MIEACGHVIDSHMAIFDCAYDAEERAIRILWGDGHRSTFHLLWLRDEDRSPKNFDACTHQRLTETSAIPLTIGARKIEVLEGGRLLAIEWDQAVGGIVRSVFDTPFLRSNCYAALEQAGGVRSQAYRPDAYTWGREFASVLPTLSVPYDRLMEAGDTGGRAALQLLSMVRLYGVAIVSGVPVDKAASQAAVERLAPIRQTLYGGFWETKVMLLSTTYRMRPSVHSPRSPASRLHRFPLSPAGGLCSMRGGLSCGTRGTRVDSLWRSSGLSA